MPDDDASEHEGSRHTPAGPAADAGASTGAVPGDLDELRDLINSVDERFLALLAERRDLAARVIELKKSKDMPLRDERREEDLLARLISVGRALGLDAHLVTRVFHEIIDDSVRTQQLNLLRHLNADQPSARTVAFQGIEGAYSHLAAQKFFGPPSDDIQFLGLETFGEVVEAVEDAAADFALLPVENTTAGNINDVYDLLSRTKLSIVGEEIFPVRHCLLAIEEAPVSRIRRVLSHPQAIAQCQNYLRQMRGCHVDYWADTAMAVRKVRDDGDLTQAAIASEEAGRLYGLKVIARDLADQKENYTRFVVVAREPIRIDSRIPSKTSLIIATAHQPGALNRALDVLGQHGINLTKLDARPKPGTPFAYLFYIDFEGHIEEPHVQEALAGLRATTSYLKILGSYAREQRGKTQPRVEALIRPATGDAKGTTASPPSKLLAIGSKTQLYSRQYRPEDTVLRVRDVLIGESDFVVIAGASAPIDEDTARRLARVAKESGARLLRAGAFRREGGHGALGPVALRAVADIAREYDLPIVAEVVAAEDVATAAEIADVLLVGAAHMQSFGLLDEVGKVDRPVILKRGIMASIEEFLGAAEYVMEHGNQQVILCERGIRTFETITRNTLDLGAIPILRSLTHLPILVDPSHAAGQPDLVRPLALAARAVGPHGLMLEVHPEPTPATGDGPQGLDFDEFSRLMGELYGR